MNDTRLDQALALIGAADTLLYELSCESSCSGVRVDLGHARKRIDDARHYIKRVTLTTGINDQHANQNISS